MNKKMNLFFFGALSPIVLGLLLQGCGGGDKTKAPEPTGAAAFVAGTHPRFDPVTKDLPFNTDLIFAKAAATDGTADVGSAIDATTGKLNPVLAALNVMDGFSTSAYFDVMMSGSVNPTSVLPMKTVFLVEVNTDGKDALNPANIIGLGAPASFDTQVVSLDGGSNNAVRIRPLLPLKSKTKYVVFLTNGIVDAAGKPLTRSWTYNALHDPSYLTLEALLPVRTAVLGWEKLAGGFLAAVTKTTVEVAVEKLVLSYTFTTTDPQAPLIAMAAPRAAVASLQMKAGVVPATAVANVMGLDAAGLLSTPKQRPLGVSPLTGVDMGMLSGGKLLNGVGNLYTGYIKLPYYLSTPKDLLLNEYLTRSWMPDKVLAGKLGVTVPADLDGNFNVTYRYPFAAKTADESVPLQVTLPEYAGPAGCGQGYAASGYPVVIYVHGVTSDRSSGLALMHTLASQCVATVAIDLPLHGIAAISPFVNDLNVEKNSKISFAKLYEGNAPHERHFNVAGAGGAPAPMSFVAPTVNDDSGTQFMNLGYLANTRDNNRQAVIDLLNVNASLKGINEDFLKGLGVSLDLKRVYVVGVSLGGAIGINFATVNQAAIASDKLVGLASNLNPIRGIVASATGTQLSQIIINSPRFGPSINGGLAAAGIKAGSSNYEKFIYAIQSLLDSADPVSFSQLLATQSVPVLLQQIHNDQVILNAISGAPLSGTQAMAGLLNVEQLGLGETQLGRGYVKMNAGVHTSLLLPEDKTPQVTAELQAQAVSFILGNGKVAVGAKAAANVQLP